MDFFGRQLPDMPVTGDAHFGEGDELHAARRRALDEGANLFKVGGLVARRVMELDGRGAKTSHSAPRIMFSRTARKPNDPYWQLPKRCGQLHAGTSYETNASLRRGTR